MVSPLVLGIAGIVSFFVIVPIGFLIFGMFWTGAPGRAGEFTDANIIAAFTDHRSLALLGNTLTYAIGSSVMTIAIATSFAWIVNRTNTPGRRLLDIVPLLGFMFPSMMNDFAWIFLLGPNAGVINLYAVQYLGWLLGPGPYFNIFSVWGMIWSQGLALVPVAYLLLSGAFATMDPSMEEAARISGANGKRTMVKITFPLLKPAIIATGSLMFIGGIHSFETPVFLGMPGGVWVYMSAVYDSMRLNLPPMYGLAAAQSVVFLALSAIVVGLYLRATHRLRAFVVVTGKGYRPKPIDLGKWRYVALGAAMLYVAVALGLPVTIMTIISFVPYWSASIIAVGGSPVTKFTIDHYLTAFDTPMIIDGAWTSVKLGVMTASLSIFVSSIIAYISVKSQLRGKRVMEVVSTLPIVYPSMVFSLALLWTFISIPTGLPGTIWILVLAYLIIFLPFSVRTMTNSLIQIHSELEEAARTSGAPWLSAFMRITMPLLKHALVNTFIFVFIQSYRQLGAAVLLVAPGTIVFPVIIMNFWTSSGHLGLTAAAVILYGSVLMIVVMVARYVFKAKIGM